MQIQDLLSRIIANRISLKLQGDSIKIAYSNAVSIDPNLLDEIRNNKAALTLFLKQQQRNELDRQLKNQIPVAPPQKSYPLSSAQRRLWVLSQFERGSVAYNMPSHMEILGPYDSDALRAAVLAVVKRHEILRTVFKEDENGEIRQWIIDTAKFSLPIDEIDLTRSPNASDDVKRYFQINDHEPFDLENGPLIKVKLLRLSSEKTIFYYNMHHLISDGWSVKILTNDFFEYYNAYIEGRTPALPELRIQYKDYAAWQLSKLEESTFSAHRDYWLEQLSGSLPVIDLPSSLKRPKGQTYNGLTLLTLLDSSLTSRIKNFVQQNGGTAYMGLLTSVKAFLNVYTGQDDIIIGSPIAGRDHDDLKAQIGFYVNTIVLRSKLEPDETFHSLFSKVKYTALEAFDHAVYPFDQLVEELELKRDVTRSAIFDINVAFQDAEPDTVGLELSEENTDEIKEVGVETSIFDVVLTFSDLTTHFALSVRYNTDVYDRTSIERFIRYYKRFIDAATRGPGEKLSALSYLPENDVEKLIASLRRKSGPAVAKPFVEQFVEQATTNPQATAVRCQGIPISYGDLHSVSTKIANLIHRIPVVKPTLIGVWIDNSVHAISSILGILKAGCAYLPLDVNSPASRLKQIIVDSNLRLIITDKGNQRAASRLQWECPSLDHLVYVDGGNGEVESGEHEKNELMNVDLWDYVGASATDVITAGGWVSSYTGMPFSRLEMEEYAENALQKLRPFLNKNTRVLEIGCSSGLTMFKVAPWVKYYHGTDMSGTILLRTEREVQNQRLTHVKLSRVVAHEIDRIQENDFDVIIINSVVQSFSGFNYLQEVIGSCINLLNREGVIFLGDLQDLDLKEQLVESLVNFRKLNYKAGNKTKTDWENELFVSRSFLSDLACDFPSITSLRYSPKNGTVENELTKFRFDCLLTVNKDNERTERPRNKFQYNLPDLSVSSTYEGLTYAGDPLAYVIYTSGSTGLPKGAAVPWSALLNYTTFASAHYFPKNQRCAVGLITSLSFDLSLTALFAPLTRGDTINLYGGTNPAEILREVFSSDAEVIKLTPAHISLLEALEINAISINTCVVGGEALLPGHVATLRRLNPAMVIINEYGPTEATVGISTFEINEGVHVNSLSQVPIGGPIWNTSLFVLNDRNVIQPWGVTGELAIGGSSLARGYLNQPELTAERFTDIPYCGRAYKTGDLAKLSEQGVLIYEGRKDEQVKIRGYRVELTEIEILVKEYPLISDAIVLAFENKFGEQEIAAYFISGEETDVEDIRNFLATRLPSYMVPAVFLRLQEFPLTKNGKIDKSKLPRPAEYSGASKTFSPPTTDLQRQLIEIWELVLQKKDIGIKDNFFEWGGHSLKATRVVAHVNARLEHKLKLEEIFNFPTIEELALVIEDKKKEVFHPILSIEEQQHYALSAYQLQFWKLLQFDAATFSDCIPVTLRYKGDFEFLLNALNNLVGKHEMLRTYFIDRDGVPRQVVVPVEEAMIRPELTALPAAVDKHNFLQSFLEKERSAKIDITVFPIFSLKIIRWDDAEYIIVYKIPHIISDGVSFGILRNDLKKLLETKATDNLAAEAVVIQYKDFAFWQRERIAEKTGPMHYWMERLKDIRQAAAFRATGDPVRLKGYLHSFAIDHVTSSEIEAFSKRNGISTYMLFVSALKVLLYRITGNRDIIIGSAVAGRLHAQLESVVGPCVNTVLLRTTIGDDDPLFAVLNKVKITVLGALENQFVPYPMLLEYVQEKYNVDSIFEVGFTYQNHQQPGQADHPLEALNGYFIHQTEVESLYPLWIVVAPGFQDAYNFDFKYNHQIFREAEILQLEKYYRLILDLILKESSTAVKDVKLVSDAVDLMPISFDMHL